MSARAELFLWLVQRATAVILGGAVLVHLATIIYAERAGLSAAAILARTAGNRAWLAFYLLFVAAAASHGAIGLRNVLGETLGWRGGTRDGAVLLAGILAAALGFRAAIGLFA